MWLPGVDGLAVPLTRRFSGRADHRTDRRPGVPLVPGPDDGVTEVSLGVGAGQDRVADRSECCGVANVCGLGPFEAGGERVGVVEDLLGGARHGDHLRYFGRAGMA